MTSIEPGSGWTERLNPRNWTLSWKLAVVGLVPALLALALGVMRIADDAQQASELSRSSRLVEVRDQVAGAANALRQERDESALFAAGDRTGDRSVLQIGYGQADGQVNEMLGALRGTSELDPASATSLQQVEASLTRLSTLRTDVTGNPAVQSDQVVNRYGEIIGPIDVLDRAVLRQLRTPGTAGLADAITAVTGATEQLSVEHTVVGAAIRANKVLPGDAAVLSVAAAQIVTEYRDYRAAVSPDQFARFGSFLDDSANSRRDQLRSSVLSAAPGQITTPATEWDAAYGASRGAADRTAEKIRGELVATSTAAGNRASNLAGINAVILMLGLLIGITIAVLVARALVRSLRVLRTSALDVAERRLPQTVESVRAGETPDISVSPVPLTGRDEVVQVARAFDTVHSQAIKLAADQATLQAGISAMFVNLSRRSQALVERQLQLIEQLENNEQDADQLSNLFQLDHLATRMRRNSENLLVLAGTDVAKRNVAAVPMVDVLRAAVSEVDQYQRIVVQAPPTVTILGRAASDLVHLLAELLDNATNFSPPDSQVVMSSTRTADGAIVVEIADRGVGMTDDELGAANTRLSGPASVDVSTSRRMGLFVVGRLATRHGVDVRLSSSIGGPGSGLTASVTVPTSLVPTGEPRRTAALTASNPRNQLPAGGEFVPQRPGRNGTGRVGSLSALVAGKDGPDVSPPETSGEKPSLQPSSTPNGMVHGLPTRQPGSTLRPAAVPLSNTPPSNGRADVVPAAERGAAGSDPDRPDDDRRDDDRAARAIVDGPVIERPGTDQPVVDRSTAERPHPDRPPTDRPIADRPVPDRPVPDRPVPDRAGAAAEIRPAAESPARNGAPSHAYRDAMAAATDTPPHGSPARPADTWPIPDAAQEPSSSAAAAVADTTAVDSGADQRERPTTGPVTRAGDPAVAARGAAYGPPPATDHSPGRNGTGHNGAGNTVARTDPTPVVERRTAPLPQRRPSPQPDQRPGGPRPFPRQGAPVRPGSDPRSDRPAPQSVEGLFASRPPAAPEPLDAAPSVPYFDPTETTPIFEEIASAWFRSNRAVPVEYGSEPAPAPAAEIPPSPLRPPAPFAPPPPIGRPTGQPVPVPERVAAEAADTPDHGFASLADDGWRAAQGMSEQSRGDELTTAGLPKRRPRARLVPGSAGSAVLAAPAAPSRNAESVRGRLASYQQGVRMGRENRERGDTQPGASPADGAAAQNGTPHGSTEQGNHDEESS